MSFSCGRRQQLSSSRRFLTLTLCLGCLLVIGCDNAKKKDEPQPAEVVESIPVNFDDVMTEMGVKLWKVSMPTGQETKQLHLIVREVSTGEDEVLAKFYPDKSGRNIGAYVSIRPESQAQLLANTNKIIIRLGSIDGIMGVATIDNPLIGCGDVIFIQNLKLRDDRILLCVGFEEMNSGKRKVEIFLRPYAKKAERK